MPIEIDWEEEDGLEVPISALEHFSYCPRQCALIHVEQTFDENVYTIRGKHAHERIDLGEISTTAGVRVLRSVPLWSERYGLRGKADVVELRPAGPYPVEYKVGARHGIHPDIQLCAQALCLEEMLGTSVPVGAIYYGATRRRHEVRIDDRLRQLTIDAIQGVRRLLRAQRLPDAPNDERCTNCSLIHSCLPSVVSSSARLRGLQGALFRPMVLYEPGDEFDLAPAESSDA